MFQPPGPDIARRFAPNGVHATTSLTCANSVWPTFMRYPGWVVRPVSIANAPGAMQIVDSHETLETPVTIDVVGDCNQMNRTLHVRGMC